MLLSKDLEVNGHTHCYGVVKPSFSKILLFMVIIKLLYACFVTQLQHSQSTSLGIQSMSAKVFQAVPSLL